MRIFMTGASGYIGSVVAEKAIKQGHQIVGLARSEASTEKLKALGVKPLNGTLESLDALTEAAAEADAVLHLGFVHEFHRPYEELIAIDIAATKAMGKGLSGTNKPLITTSGTGLTATPKGGLTDETSPITTDSIFKLRANAEQATTELSKDGVRSVVIRVAPYTYGRGGSYFVPVLMKIAAENGFAPYVGEGTSMTTSVDVDVLADLYLLAMKNAKAGSIFNGTTEHDVKIRQLAETIGQAVGVPAKSITSEEAVKVCGFFIAKVIEYELRASNEKAKRELGWNPQPTYGLLDDITRGSYQPLATELKSKVAVKK
jgi:nucleoside-diphosphate-sugar epimerase